MYGETNQPISNTKVNFGNSLILSANYVILYNDFMASVNNTTNPAVSLTNLIVNLCARE